MIAEGEERAPPVRRPRSQSPGGAALWVRGRPKDAPTRSPKAELVTEWCRTLSARPSEGRADMVAKGEERALLLLLLLRGTLMLLRCAAAEQEERVGGRPSASATRGELRMCCWDRRLEAASRGRASFCEVGDRCEACGPAAARRRG